MKKLFITMLLALLGGQLMAQSWIGFFVSNTVEIDATANSATLVIPMKIDTGMLWKDVSLKYNGRLFYIKLVNKFNQQYLEAFSPVTKVDSLVPCIRMQVDVQKLRQQGSYETAIDFSAPGKNQVSLPLIIKRPAATLDTTGTITINAVGNDVHADPLVIKETSHNSNIPVLNLPAPGFKGTGGTAIIRFSNPYTIAAGTTNQIRYEVDTARVLHLPLGKTTGKMEISAPEMSAPLIVPFEIINRRSRYWIILFIFLGLLTGALVRHLLQRKKVAEESKQKALTLIKRLQEESSAVEDSAFRAAVTALINTLHNKVQDTNAFFHLMKGPGTEIEDQIQKTITDYTALKATFDQSVAAVKEALKQVAHCFENNDLTMVIKGKLAPAEKFYDLAKANLAKGNPTVAGANVEDMNIALKRFLTRYTAKVSQLMASLEAGTIYPQTVPDTLKNNIAVFVTSMKTDLNAITMANSPGNTEVFTADNIEFNLLKALGLIRNKVAALFQQSVQVQTPDAEMLKDFSSSYDTWDAALQGIIADPENDMDPSVVRTLDNNWSKVNQLSPQARVVMSAVSTGARADNELQFDRKNNVLAGSGFAGSTPSISTISIEFRQSQEFWIIYSALQTNILSLIIGAIAFKFYGPDFTGTADELITIFVFAFGIDITADNVAQLKGVKP